MPVMVANLCKGRAEVTRTTADRDFIAGIAQVAKNQISIWNAADEARFQPTEILHSLGQRVADEANVVALFQLQIGRDGEVGKEQERQAEEKSLHGQ